MDAKIIGQKLRSLRGERKAKKVADAIGITQTALSNYESGLRIPRDEIKKKIAKYFETTVDDIFFTV